MTKELVRTASGAAGHNPSGRRADGELPRSAFRPGQSGNPAGLPEAVREIRALAAEHGADAVARLVELMQQVERPELALAAACALLDRCGAKSFSIEPERLELSHVPGDSVATLSLLIARRFAAVGAGSAPVNAQLTGG